MVYVFLADGFEEIEALTVVDLGRRAGLDVQTVSITRDTTVTGARDIPVVTDTVIKKVDWDGADMLVLPGGMPGTRNLEACEELMEHVDEMSRSGRNVSAICAAPTILGHIKRPSSMLLSRTGRPAGRGYGMCRYRERGWQYHYIQRSGHRDRFCSRHHHEARIQREGR